MAEPGSSSLGTGQKPVIFCLLPTPCATEASGGQLVSRRVAQGHQVRLSDVLVSLALGKPTSKSELAQSGRLPGDDMESPSGAGRS